MWQRRNAQRVGEGWIPCRVCARRRVGSGCCSKACLLCSPSVVLIFSACTMVSLEAALSLLTSVRYRLQNSTFSISSLVSFGLAAAAAADDDDSLPSCDDEVDACAGAAGAADAAGVDTVPVAGLTGGASAGLAAPGAAASVGFASVVASPSSGIGLSACQLLSAGNTCGLQRRRQRARQNSSLHRSRDGHVQTLCLCQAKLK